jgi:Holliday junction resolvase RusA-like endonuclease
MKRTASQDAPESSVRGERAKKANLPIVAPLAPQANVQSPSAARAVIVELPLPPKECHQNFRGAHATRERMVAVRYARYLAWQTATQLSTTGGYGLLPEWERCAVSLAFRFPDARRRDIWNFAGACKAFLDGLADAGVMADDSDIVYGQVSAVIDRHVSGVTITIMPIAEGE